jgi:hypothetical protein
VLRWLVGLVIAYVVLLGAGRLAQTEHGPRILAVGGVVFGIGWVVYRLTRTGPPIRRSGRDPGDVGPIDTMAFPDQRDNGP